jgi:hypothetical protein
MKWLALLWVPVIAVCLVAVACNDEEGGGPMVIEQVDGYKANLPPVPKIPKPNVPETYGDGSYSVYGLRKNMVKTIDTPVVVTAHVASKYEKPVCPEGKTCHTLMPHLFLADDPNEQIEKRTLKLVGYAQNFKEMEEQELVDKGEEKAVELEEDQFLKEVVWDWRKGNKYKINGFFSRESGAGFKATDGLLDFETRKCLDCDVEKWEEEKKERDAKAAEDKAKEEAKEKK